MNALGECLRTILKNLSNPYFSPSLYGANPNHNSISWNFTPLFLKTLNASVTSESFNTLTLTLPLTYSLISLINSLINLPIAIPKIISKYQLSHSLGTTFTNICISIPMSLLFSIQSLTYSNSLTASVPALAVALMCTHALHRIFLTLRSGRILEYVTTSYDPIYQTSIYV